MPASGISFVSVKKNDACCKAGILFLGNLSQTLLKNSYENNRPQHHKQDKKNCIPRQPPGRVGGLFRSTEPRLHEPRRHRGHRGFTGEEPRRTIEPRRHWGHREARRKFIELILKPL